MDSDATKENLLERNVAQKRVNWSLRQGKGIPGRRTSQQRGGDKKKETKNKKTLQTKQRTGNHRKVPAAGISRNLRVNLFASALPPPPSPVVCCDHPS